MDAEEIAALAEQFRRDIAEGQFDQAHSQMHPSFRARADVDALKKLVEHSPIRRHLGCTLGDPEAMGDGFVVRDQAHHDVYILVDDVNGAWYVSEVAAEETGFM